MNSRSLSLRRSIRNQRRNNWTGINQNINQNTTRRARSACFAYVDPNPRCRWPPSPRSKGHRPSRQTKPPTQPPELYPFVGGTREGRLEGLPFHLADYLELVNWTGRAVRDDKRGAIGEDLPPILERIGVTRAAWQRVDP